MGGTMVTMILVMFAATCATVVVAAPAGGPRAPGQLPPHPPASHAHHVHLITHTDLPRAHLPASVWARAEPVPLNATRLLAGSVYQEAQELNSQYLHLLDLDRLLYQFRHFAGLPTGNVQPYGGWESPNYQWGLLNGHFTGHLLSALAFDAAGTDSSSTVTAAKGDSLVAELAKCQTAVAKAHPERAGWLSAYSIAQMDRLDAHNTTHVWAPYYTLHKIMAGLLDQYEQRGSIQAMDVLLKMASYLHQRIASLREKRGIAWWAECLKVEFGGMNEVGYSLFAITGDPRHRQLGDWFFKSEFMDPLAAGQDSLNNNHANTHLPEVVGVARGWEVTQNRTLATITANFHSILGDHYSYATGGSNVNEHWSSPDQLGDAVATTFNSQRQPQNSNGFHTEETCTQYNTLKMLRHLFRWHPSASIADDYEIKLNNGILGVQQPGVVGSMSYMTPLGRGVNRNRWDWYGFGNHNNSFWCCYGTTIEQFAKLGDSIYFRSWPNSTSSTYTLFVSQFIPSTMQWPEAGGLMLKQADSLTTVTHSGGHDAQTGAKAVLAVNLSFSFSNLSDTQAEAKLHLKLRVPGWTAPGSSVFVQRAGKAGAPLRLPQTRGGSFLDVAPPSGGWQSGDVVCGSFAMLPKLKPINDRRPAYKNVAAIMIGPFVLAGLTNFSDVIVADPAKVEQWVVPRPHIDTRGNGRRGSDGRLEMGDLALTAVGRNQNYTLVPLNRMVFENYTVYFNVSGDR